MALLPSAEAAFVAFAKAQGALLALHGGRVGTRLNATLPALRIARIAGSPPWPWRDEPHIQVECWAADQGTADLLARTVVAALPDIANTTVTGGRVWTAEVVSGPYWAPDDPALTENARYILTVALLLTP